MKNLFTIKLTDAFRSVKDNWERIVFCEGARVDPGCAYCDLFLKKPKCVGCPINLTGKAMKERGACRMPGHPFLEWFYDRTKENAQKVLDLIIKTKPE